MSDNDLRVMVARCMQNFADVEGHNPNTCYVPPSLETLDERAKHSYLNDALFHRKVDTIVYAVREHNTALRSQVAELQRQLRKKTRDIIAQSANVVLLERQLDDAAKQHSVGVGARWPDEADKRILYLLWTEGEIEETEYVGMEAVKLYALPPNLPAMIEQARAEEREACAKVCESEWVGDSLNDESGSNADTAYNEGRRDCADAIRARGEKK